MCTVSLVPPGSNRGWRLVVNRDERRTRSIGWPPEMRQVGERTLMSPVDSEGLGTWAAASDAGLGYALLNASAAPGLLPQIGSTSRGTIIPLVSPSATPSEALDRLATLPLTSIAPFQLVVVSEDEMASGHWDGRVLRAAREVLMRPRLFASSSLGDDHVIAARTELFERLLDEDGDPWLAQDRLHVHAWPDRRHLSVNMSRLDACTVSRTAIVAGDDLMDLTYVPYVDGWPGPATTRRLPRRNRRLADAA